MKLGIYKSSEFVRPSSLNSFISSSLISLCDFYSFSTLNRSSDLTQFSFSSISFDFNINLRNQSIKHRSLLSLIVMGLSKNIDFEITLRNQSIKRRSLLRSMIMGLPRNSWSREYAESMKSKLPSDIKKKRKLEEEEHAAFTCSKKPPAIVSKNEEFKCSDVDATRNQFRERLVEGLSKVYEENNEEMMKEQLRACDPVGVAASVESALFKTLGPISGSNKPQYRTILFSVRNSRNPDFRRKILLGEVKPESLPTMTDEEIASDKLQEKIREIRERVLAKIPDSVDDDDDPYERLKADDHWLFYRSYIG